MNGMLLYQITNGKRRATVREAGPSRYIVRVDGSKHINIVKTISEARQTADDRYMSLVKLDELEAKARKKG